MISEMGTSGIRMSWSLPEKNKTGEPPWQSADNWGPMGVFPAQPYFI